jgi:hypothetical protein
MDERQNPISKRRRTWADRRAPMIVRGIDVDAQAKPVRKS